MVYDPESGVRVDWYSAYVEAVAEADALRVFAESVLGVLAGVSEGVVPSGEDWALLGAELREVPRAPRVHSAPAGEGEG